MASAEASLRSPRKTNALVRWLSDAGAAPPLLPCCARLSATRPSLSPSMPATCSVEAAAVPLTMSNTSPAATPPRAATESGATELTSKPGSPACARGLRLRPTGWPRTLSSSTVRVRPCTSEQRASRPLRPPRTASSASSRRRSSAVHSSPASGEPPECGTRASSSSSVSSRGEIASRLAAKLAATCWLAPAASLSLSSQRSSSACASWVIASEAMISHRSPYLPRMASSSPSSTASSARTVATLASQVSVSSANDAMELRSDCSPPLACTCRTSSCSCAGKILVLVRADCSTACSACGRSSAMS
eukprot:scaffold64057_cov48-Phaeocystis_antarctica.AAC.2